MTTIIPRLLASLLLVFSCITRAAEPAEPEDVPLFTQAELDQMLAPVALYPDELLSQLLMAATYPLEVVEAARFSRANPSLKGQDAVRVAQDKPWDPSVKAMLAFPQILDRMDQDLDWTRRLGDAFLAQQQQVMDTVQALRNRADEAGNLKETEHVQVVREERTIIVRNRYPDVVYVPYYDPLLIYGDWWWPDYRPVRWSAWPGYTYYSGYNGFFWGPSVVVGYGFFFGHYDWRDRYVRIVEAPPFYYRRPPPPRYRWEHEYRHRKGVPYRHQRVYDRYHDERDPVPRRPPRDRYDDPQDHHRDGQPPAGGPRDGQPGGGRHPPGDGHQPGDGQAPGDGRPPRDGSAPGDVTAPGDGRPPADGTPPADGQTPGTPPADGGPRGAPPGRDRPDGRPVSPAPVMGTDSRVPAARAETDDTRGRDRESRLGREDAGRNRRETPATRTEPVAAPESRTAPSDVRESIPRYSPPPRETSPDTRESRPRYTPPSRETPSYNTPRESRPSYTPPSRRESSDDDAPSSRTSRQERPSYSQPSYSAPERSTPTYSAPRQERPSYSAPRQERPSYSAPERSTPSYSAPRQERPSYSAPRQERPSYSAPERSTPTYSAPRQERPSYSAPRQERPSYTPPPRSEPSNQGSGESSPRRNRERPDRA